MKYWGPLVDVLVRAHPQVTQTPNFPPPGAESEVTVTAMIDTGASGTFIKAGIADRLGIKPVGSMNVIGPTKAGHPCDVYQMVFALPSSDGSIVVNIDEAIEVPLPLQNIECLIGRDILAHAVLTYVGPENYFTLSL